MTEPSQPDAVRSGVYYADPMCPPVPPPQALAVVTVDAEGNIISYTWAAPAHARTLMDASWDWHDRVMRASGLRLVP